jgi:hypothetical protein
MEEAELEVVPVCLLVFPKDRDPETMRKKAKGCPIKLVTVIMWILWNATPILMKMEALLLVTLLKMVVLGKRLVELIVLPVVNTVI